MFLQNGCERLTILRHVGREKVFLVAISSPSREEMGRLHTQHKINIIEHTAAIQGDRFSVDAFVTASQMETLREEDFEVEVIRDMDEVVEELKDAVSDEEQDVG